MPLSDPLVRQVKLGYEVTVHPFKANQSERGHELEHIQSDK